jgi:hypothetical protein
MNVHLLNPARSTELLVKALYRLAVPRSGFEVSTLCFAFERPVRSLNVAPESPTRAFETKLAVTIGRHDWLSLNSFVSIQGPTCSKQGLQDNIPPSTPSCHVSTTSARICDQAHR